MRRSEIRKLFLAVGTLALLIIPAQGLSVSRAALGETSHAGVDHPTELSPRLQPTEFSAGSASNGGNVTATITVGTLPTSELFDEGDGYVYVGNSATSSSNMSVVSGVHVIGSIPLGVTYDSTMVDDSSNGYLYVTTVHNYSSWDNVSVVSGLTVLTSIAVGKITGPVACQPFPVDLMTYDSKNGDVYVANCGSNNVTIISGTAAVGTVPVGSEPIAVTCDSSNGDVYVSNYGSDNITVISGTKVVGTISVGFGPISLGYDGADGYVYVANEASNNVSVISGVNLVATVALPFPTTSPDAIVYDSGLGEVYVASGGISNSQLVNIISGTGWVADIPVGSESVAEAYDSTNGDVYVANMGSNNVSVLHGTGLVETLTVGSRPSAIVSDPTNGDVYVMNSDCATSPCSPGTLSVISSGASSGPSLSSVAVVPSSVSVIVGATQLFSATASCTGGPCPAGVTYTWSLNNTIGSVYPTSGSTTTFTANSSPGSATLTVTASLSGKSVPGTGVITVVAPLCSGQPWQQCSMFKVVSGNVTIPEVENQAMSCWLGGLNPLCSSNLNADVYSLYTIVPSSSASSEQFSAALQGEFGLSPPSGYQSPIVFMIHAPVMTTVNHIIQDEPTVSWVTGGFQFPIETVEAPPYSVPTVAGVTPHVHINADGSIDLLFVLSLDPAGDYAKAFLQNLGVGSPQDIGTLLVTLLAGLIKGDYQDVIKALEDLGGKLAFNSPGAVAAALASVFELQVAFLSPGLSSGGQQGAIPFFDLDGFLNGVTTANQWLTTLSGLPETILQFIFHLGETIGLLPSDVLIAPIPLDAFHAMQTMFDGLYMCVEAYELLPGPPPGSTEQSIDDALQVITSVVDPNGSTVLPAYYDSSGALVLGVDHVSGKATWTSSSGVLIPGIDSSLAILRANGTNGPPANYTEKVWGMDHASCPTCAAPFTVVAKSYNTNATPPGLRVAGIAPVGQNVTIRLWTIGNGSLPLLTVLHPVVWVSGSEGHYEIKGLEYDQAGDPLHASAFYLFINGTEYAMSSCQGEMFCANLSLALAYGIEGFAYPWVPGSIGGVALFWLNASSSQPPNSSAPFLGLPGALGYIVLGLIVTAVVGTMLLVVLRFRSSRGKYHQAPSSPTIAGDSTALSTSPGKGQPPSGPPPLPKP